MEIKVTELTIGDLVYLAQGNIIPADLRLINTKNLEINESALTGESVAVEKTEAPINEDITSISQFKNIAFMGTAVESGSGQGIVIRLGKDTEYGKIAKSASFIKPSTDFEKGLNSFGSLIVKVILTLVSVMFVIDTLLHHGILESLLFALAIAVGLTPELLPVIVTVSLSHGAGKLAKKHVITKQLISIENIGNMDILCTDKTGTLTEGKINVVGSFNLQDMPDPSVVQNSLLCNSAIVHHKVIGDGIDVALWEYAIKNKISNDPKLKKIDEEPFDFNRKLMYSVIHENESTYMVSKGAPESILPLCCNIDDSEQQLLAKFQALNNDGLRVILVARKDIEHKGEYNWDDLNNLNLIGYVTFLDIPKPSAKAAIDKLHKLNVFVKIVTGDNAIITQKICREVGMEIQGVLTGSQMEGMSDPDLEKEVIANNIFARVNPEQKLKIIQTLRKLGHTVGYMGDGINDIPALHSADVGISVDKAVDVAKESASIVLLRNGLDVIADGVIEGRRTFNNTIKYILMGTSSNFGNMFSAAGASFFLPFLPMTAAQILLTNGLYDLSQLSIPSDNVDPESLVKPRHWNINFIRNYMIFFGPISSLYDFLTFGVLLFIFHANQSLFQTGWFIESLATEILVVFVIRTSIIPFYKSKPGKWLTLTCVSIVAFGIALVFTPIGHMFQFVAPPPPYFLILAVLVVTYLVLVEKLKSYFLKKFIL